MRKVFLFSMLCLSLIVAKAQTPKLTDSDIAHVGVTANQIDIDYAAIATSTSKNKDVLNFAKTMSQDHTAVIAQATALVTKLKVTPTDNAVSKSLNDGAAKKRTELKALTGAAFDKAYIDNEVEYHKAVIGAVKTVLIPQAQNAELKTFLQNLVPALEGHLHHAEMIQKQFSKK